MRILQIKRVFFVLVLWDCELGVWQASSLQNFLAIKFLFGFNCLFCLHSFWFLGCHAADQSWSYNFSVANAIFFPFHFCCFAVHPHHCLSFSDINLLSVSVGVWRPQWHSLCVAALKIYPLALHMCACRNTFHCHLKSICFLSTFLLVPHIRLKWSSRSYQNLVQGLLHFSKCFKV